MRAWAFLLGGMIVWTVHFFMLYIIASIFLTSPLSRTLTLLVPLLCLAADGMLLARAARLKRDWQTHGVSSWKNSLATLFAALSLVAFFWLGLCALLVCVGHKTELWDRLKYVIQTTT